MPVQNDMSSVIRKFGVPDKSGMLTLVYLFVTSASASTGRAGR